MVAEDKNQKMARKKRLQLGDVRLLPENEEYPWNIAVAHKGNEMYQKSVFPKWGRKGKQHTFWMRITNP